MHHKAECERAKHPHQRQVSTRAPICRRSRCPAVGLTGPEGSSSRPPRHVCWRVERPSASLVPARRSPIGLLEQASRQWRRACRGSRRSLHTNNAATATPYKLEVVSFNLSRIHCWPEIFRLNTFLFFALSLFFVASASAPRTLQLARTRRPCLSGRSTLTYTRRARYTGRARHEHDTRLPDLTPLFVQI